MAKLSNKDIDFLKYSIDNKYPLELKWILDVLTFIAETEYEDNYIIISNKQIYYKKFINNNTEEILLRENYKEPLFNVKDELSIPKGFLPNLKKDITTTVGRLLMNYILLSNVFGDKIEYINDVFTIGDIESKYIIKLLSDKPQGNQISVEEYRKFIKMVNYINSFSKYLSIISTNKTILPAPNIDKIKKEIIEKYKKKYGEKGLRDPRVVKEIENELVKYDNEYLKDDPSVGKLLSGKTKNIARKRLYLMFGIGNAVIEDPKPILTSLEEGWQKDPEDLTTLYNDARGGSYSRGAETQQGGVVAKNTLRATSDIKILKTDCGSKVYRKQLVTKDNINNLVGRYANINGKLTLLTQDILIKLTDKIIDLRSPMTCKAAPNFCTICMGEGVRDYENGMSLMASGIGGDMLNESLKKMHGVELKVVELDTNVFE